MKPTPTMSAMKARKSGYVVSTGMRSVTKIGATKTTYGVARKIQEALRRDDLVLVEELPEIAVRLQNARAALGLDDLSDDSGPRR